MRVSRPVLEAIVAAAACSLLCSDSHASQSCFETVVTLHGLLHIARLVHCIGEKIAP